MTDALSLAGGATFSAARMADGTVWTWGNNGGGQLGNGTFTSSATPVQTVGLHGVIAVAAGAADDALALQADGTVWGWGSNSWGMAGLGTTPLSNTPVQIPGLTHMTGIAAGWYHSLAVSQAGTVWAWGDNGFGELGSTTPPCDTGRPCSLTPVPVAGLSGVTAVAAGLYFSLALKADGTVWAWGQDFWGQLGDGANTDSTTPVQVKNLTNTVALAAGSDFALALTADGTVWGWGLNTNGRLGTNPTSNVPLPINGISQVVALAAGDNFSLALKSDGTVWGWGADDAYQLAVPDEQDHPTPLQIGQVSGAAAIAAGQDFGLAAVAPARIQASALGGSYKATVTITGTNFGGGDPIAVYWDSPSTPAVTRTTTTAQGAFVATVQVPQAVQGRHTIIAVDATHAVSATAPFDVRPALLVVPSQGLPGAHAVVMGVGFGKQERITLYWDKPLHVLGTTTSNALGSFYSSTGVTVTVPQSVTVGVHLVYGSGLTSHAIGVGLFVIP